MLRAIRGGKDVVDEIALDDRARLRPESVDAS
jgi:hypothetical protein